MRAGVDRWLDWTLSTLQPVDRPVFWALVRTPAEQRDMAAIQKDADAEAAQWRIVDAQLASRRFIEGDDFTLADIALGAYARRWFGVEGISKPKLRASRALVRAIRQPAGICAIHRAADVVRATIDGLDPIGAARSMRDERMPITRAKAAGRYLTNLTPNDFPRRQTTSQFRPDLASRENASRSLPASTCGLHRDLRAGGGHVVHHARTRRKAAVEGDPPGLMHRFARFALLAGCGHFLVPRKMLLSPFPIPRGL